MAVRIYALGPLQVQSDGRGTILALRRKTSALLVYLLVTGRAHHRERLIDLFCQQADRPAATLRTLLSRIRQLAPEALLTENQTVLYDPRSVWVDFLEFEGVFGGDLASHPVGTLTSTADLYRGEFLQGLALPDAPEFELWLLGERVRFIQLHEKGLTELVERLTSQEQYPEAILRTRQLIQANPLLERAHVRLISLYAWTGQRQAALEQYERCRKLLLRELAVEPSPELHALQQEILAGRAPVPSESLISAPPVEVRQSASLVGRDTELWASERAAAARANAESIHYLERALERIIDPESRLRLMCTLGDAWRAAGQEDKALACYRLAVEIDQQLSRKVGLSIQSGGITLICCETGNDDSDRT
jgi:DNA-binding SARP family transcriptional activator